MAGKSKKAAHRAPVQSTAPRGMMGHLGLKSSPFAPTDSKLTSQYMVMDHMSAHYRNLHSVKPCVDTTTPRAWVISQKARDRTRREALKTEAKRRDQWLSSQPNTARPASQASSEDDRERMLAMMKGYTGNDHGGYDDIDGAANHTTLEVHASDGSDSAMNSRDLRLVDRIISDSHQSPSHYHSMKVMRSNIPGSRASPRVKIIQRSSGISSGDLITKQSHCFTEEKPFTPRTLKTKSVTSKLNDFKYYNPPRRRPSESAKEELGGRRGSVSRSRPETPVTESVDLMMNETLMSRDGSKPTPMGIPPLDISLDADHIRWLKEQSKTAQIRANLRTADSEHNSNRGATHHSAHQTAPEPALRTLTLRNDHSLALDGTAGMTSRYPTSRMLYNVEQEEEELKYLEFITDVTNDVLDRGIYTNRVLKQVFDSHFTQRKGQLKQSKMREMLDDLRRDLGIPESDEEDEVGLTTARSASPDQPVSHLYDPGPSKLNSTFPATQSSARASRLNGLDDSHKANLPSLKASRKGGKPPLPRPASRGSHSRPNSACSGNILHDVKEDPESELDHGAGGFDGMGMTLNPRTAATLKADILKINHTDEEALEELDDENGYDEVDRMPIGESVTYDLTSLTDNGHEEEEEDEDEDDGDTEAVAALYKTGIVDSHDLLLGDTLVGEMEDTLTLSQAASTEQDKPRPTPRRRSGTPRTDYTPRSGEHTQTSESIEVSELEEDDQDGF